MIDTAFERIAEPQPPSAGMFELIADVERHFAVVDFKRQVDRYSTRKQSIEPKEAK